MSITTINSTMQAQIMQDVQRMQANAQAPVLPAMTFSSTDPDVSFNRIMSGALGHVDLHEEGAAARGADIGRRLFAAGHVHIAHNDLRACGCKSQGRGASNAARRTGNNRHFIL